MTEEKFPPAVRRYFDTLPAWLQENIRQSGMDFQTRQELRDFANRFWQE